MISVLLCFFYFRWHLLLFYPGIMGILRKFVWHWCVWHWSHERL